MLRKMINKCLIVLALITLILPNYCNGVTDEYDMLSEEMYDEYEYYEDESYEEEYYEDESYEEEYYEDEYYQEDEEYYDEENYDDTYDENSSDYDYSSYDYVLSNYNIEMLVNENNTFDITETITAYFNVEKHGIIRKIPVRNSITRLDGTKSNNRAEITNISVSENYTVSNENGYKVIKIGDADKTITGSHTYTIKYNYNIGKDPLKDADELYFNLIGDEWDTIISDVSFKIVMPKEFDESLLGFSSGKTGSTENSNIEYSVTGKTITGTVSNTLEPGEALTVRLALPDEYFVGAGFKIELFSIFTIILSILFVIIAYILWLKYGKDEQVIETVEFYPPEKFNSAEIGFLYEGEASSESVISLLIYLANKGYLKIEEIEENSSKSKGFKITKLKEYEGNNEYEKIFFNGLFENVKDNNEKPSITKSDLYNKFYITLNEIKSKLNSKENKEKIFEKAASQKIKWLIFMILAIFVLITIKPILEYGGSGTLLFALLFPGIGFGILIGALIGVVKMPKIFAIIWGGMFGGLPWAFIVLSALTQNPIYLIAYIIGIICIVAIISFAKIMPKRTKYGNEILGKIKGFRKFLETAEKNQLESLVMESPEYFYNILPYTYALGVSDVWINQFESIALVAPDWYDSRDDDDDDFNVHNFGTFMNSTMYSVSVAMTSSPSSSSDSGSSSGGGSSGGGSGGGGGSSW